MNVISSNLFRYVDYFKNNKSLASFHNNIWMHNVEPKEPCTWGELRTHRIIFPLKGDINDIIPNNSKGYLLDNTTEAFSYLGTAYSATTICWHEMSKEILLDASVYCYVSIDFNGNCASIQTNGLENCAYIDTYDLTRKGTWQKLSFKAFCDYGYTSVILYFSKQKSENFTNLKGYVIFAYPEYKVSKKNLLIPTTKLNSNIILPDLKYVNNPFKTNQEDNYLKASLFDISFINIFKINNIMLDNDPIRNFVAKIISEDTTYYQYKANLTTYQTNNNNIDRLSRWKFAIEIFTKEYNWKQKIFGGGFNFLNWYGYVFKKDKTATDYPHNPFLYILLYSGIVGVLLYFVLLYQVIKLYWRYRKEYPLFFIFFIITYYFTFFSGGNPFDPPMMGFFMMLPFLIHAVHKSEQKTSLTE